MTIEYLIPQGYFPDGSPRPMRKAVVIENINDVFCRIEYTDTKEIIVCPNNVLTEKSQNHYKRYTN